MGAEIIELLKYLIPALFGGGGVWAWFRASRQTTASIVDSRVQWLVVEMERRYTEIKADNDALRARVVEVEAELVAERRDKDDLAQRAITLATRVEELEHKLSRYTNN